MAFNNIPPNGFPALPDMEDLEAVVKDVANLKTSVTELTEDVGDLDSNKANKADIATEFSDLTNYNAGDLVYYEGALYEFQVDHTAGSWETSEVIQKDLSDIVTTLKSGLTNLISSGSFTVACVAGKNTFDRESVILVGASDTLPPDFSKCLCMITGHSGSLNSPNTIETDGANTFIIQSVSAQNLKVTWLDLSNVPIAN